MMSRHQPEPTVAPEHADPGHRDDEHGAGKKHRQETSGNIRRFLCRSHPMEIYRSIPESLCKNRPTETCRNTLENHDKNHLTEIDHNTPENPCRSHREGKSRSTHRSLCIDQRVEIESNNYFVTGTEARQDVLCNKSDHRQKKSPKTESKTPKHIFSSKHPCGCKQSPEQ